MISPTTEQELAEAVATARGPLRIRGGGTRPIGKPVAGEVLSVAGLTGITLYEPGALTLVARAGTPLADIEKALAVENQRLAFEPMDHRALLGTTGKPTIGGVVAANASGPRRVQLGACRDYLLGVRFVDGQGTITKNGGRVMKNVTGYDLVKLMAGSWGTLGVLSEVSFKVLPQSAMTATLAYDDCGFASTTALFAKAMGAPFEVSGAARLPTQAGSGRVLLRLEGFEGSVEYRITELASYLGLGPPAAVIRDPLENAALWKSVRDVEPLAKRDGDVWRISLKPSDMTTFAEAGNLLPEDVLLDWAGGLIWAVTRPGTDIRESLAGLAGHATLVRASEATRSQLAVFQPEPAPLAALSAGLRAKFDPRGILSPGLMG